MNNIEVGILFSPLINLQSYKVFQLGISHADFDPPEIIQTGIKLHIILLGGSLFNSVM